MITTRSEVEKNRNPDVFKWSKGFDRYFNAADDIFNISSLLGPMPLCKSYSIPLNYRFQLAHHRIVHRRRRNMIETVLDRSNLGGNENIYFVGDIFNQFL